VGQIIPFTGWGVADGTAAKGASVAGAKGEPHRSQNRDFGSVKVFPHFRQVRNSSGGRRAPHRLQNTDISSGAGLPQLLHLFPICIASESGLIWMID